MATPPDTLLPPGATPDNPNGGGGGPVMLDFCECACGIPLVACYVSQRSATCGPQFDAPSDPDRKPGENPYEVAQTRLAAQSYPDFEPAPYVGGSGLPAPVVLGSTQTFWEVTTGNDPSVTTQSISTDTDPQADDEGYPQASASLVQAQYKLRVNFPVPWKGDSTFTVAWRERTVHYSMLYTYGDDSADEEASITYQAFTEDVSPGQGAMYAETGIHETDAGLGDQVSITGPDALNTFFTRQMQSGSDGATACGILVTSITAAAQKCGFLPYIRAHASVSSPEDAQPQDIYASETASTAPNFPVQYSGSQIVQDSDQITISPQGVQPVNTFSPNVPSTAISQLGEGASSPATVGAVEVTPTVLQWATPPGLVMTLGDPISTGDLQSFVQDVLANAPEPLQSDVSGLLTLRYLSADELSYTVKQATQQAYLNIAIDAGIASQSPVNQLTPDNPQGTVLALGSGDVSFTVDLLTTDLDTGVQTDSQLSFSFSVNATAPGIQYFTLTQTQADVSIPTTNQKITWSNPQVTSGSFDRWCAQPQVTVKDA